VAQNLELKIKVNSHSGIIELLNNINANYKGLLNQKDIYFDWDKGLLKLRVHDKSYQLIKYFRDEKKDNRFSSYELLDLSGNNVELYLSDILKPNTVVEKKRELYIYKNTRIHLDNVKGLGDFVELETVVVPGEQDVQAEFSEVVRLLNLDLDSQIRCSYRDLINKEK
jgi:predicted adenylyl cyclase CyaB